MDWLKRLLVVNGFKCDFASIDPRFHRRSDDATMLKVPTMPPGETTWVRPGRKIIWGLLNIPQIVTYKRVKRMCAHWFSYPGDIIRRDGVIHPDYAHRVLIEEKAA